MAGFVLTCVILYLSSIGLFEKWEIVATVPENAVEVINGDPWKAYIKTSDQKILSCPFGHEDECWIPDVVSNPYNSQPCNKKIIAFSPILNPPKNLVSCRQIRDGYLETGYNLVYAIDQNYHLWKWGIVRSAYYTIFLPFLILAGGFCGVLIGSLYWVVKRVVQKRQTSSKYARFSKLHIILLALPWLLLFSILAMWLLLVSPSTKTSPSFTPNIYTAVSETVTIQMTEEVQKWAVQVTPGSGSLKYSFSKNSCDAKWSSGWESIPCFKSSDTSDFAIRTSPISSISGVPVSGEALLIPIDYAHHSVNGEFPTIEIQDGDHFKSTIGCLEESLACNILFDVYFETQEKGRILLGRWNPIGDDKVEDINIDLTKFTNQKGRFYLNISDSNNGGDRRNSDAVWLMPRIEK